MKRFFSFLAMSALLLTMASCGGNDPNNPENPNNSELNTKYFSVEVSFKETNLEYAVMHIKVTPKENVETFVYKCYPRSKAEEYGCLTLDGFWAHIKKFNLITNISYTYSGKPLEKDENLKNDVECIVFLFALDENKEPIADSWTTKTFRTPKGPNPNSVNGMMPGAFTVDASLGTKVHFSQGNLQYNAASGTWQFATNQWDVIGENNKNIAADYNGWIDLFGWNTADKPTLASDKTEDYPQSPFKDWGKNTIANGGNQTWKTLSKDEWNNIFILRTNAEKLYGFGTVAGVNGLILLPDDWKMPEGVPEFAPSRTKGLEWSSGMYYNSKNDNFTHNTYTAKEWDTMEKAGAIFMPAAGYRSGTDMYNVGVECSYWTSTTKNEYRAYCLGFNSCSLLPEDDAYLDCGQSVRLVH